MGTFCPWNPRPVARHAFYAARTVWPPGVLLVVPGNCETSHRPGDVLDYHVVEIWIPWIPIVSYLDHRRGNLQKESTVTTILDKPRSVCGSLHQKKL